MVKLKPYQIKAVLFCRQKNKVLLNMGCRTGKSLTALHAVKGSNAVVIGPPHLESFWHGENAKLNKPKNMMYVSRFKQDLLRSQALKSWPTAIVDEAHENTKWKTSENLLRFLKTKEQVIFLTATPVINNPLDFYWPLKICGAYKGNITDFKILYCGGQRRRDDPRIVFPTGLTNPKQLKSMTQSVTYSYFRDEKIKEKTIIIGAKPIENASKIEDFASFQKIQGFLKAQNKNFLKIIKKNVDKFGKVGILFFHKEVGRSLKDQFSNSFLIDGDTPIKKRNEKIKAFENSKNGIILLNYKSCGVGIDIKTVDVVFFAESTWSPAKNYQAYMRFYGHTRDKPLIVKYPVFREEERLIVSKRKEEVLLLLK